VEYAGTGRKPKYCPDHRQPSGKDKTTPASRSRKTSSKSLDVLRLELLQTLQGAGAMLMAVDKFDGLVIVQGSPKLVDALISMAEVNPQFRKFLESGTKSVVWLQLGTALAAIVVPIAAHHRMLPLNERGAYELFHGQLPAQFQAEPEPEVVTVADQQPQEQPLAEPVAAPMEDEMNWVK
jgi:hypothetical protein